MTAAQKNQHDQEDAEANYFAMCLLMPETLVRSELAKMKHFDLANDDHVKQLAKKFMVNQSLMAIRIGQIFHGSQT